jgi:hypothetical protein
MAHQGFQYRAGRAKVYLARALGSPQAGAAVALLTRNRVPHYGLRFLTADRVVSSQVKAELLFRMYESAEIRMIRRHFGSVSAGAILDLGASLGVASSHAMNMAPQIPRLLAVEPNPSLAPFLTRTIREHGDGRQGRRGINRNRLWAGGVSARRGSDLCYFAARAGGYSGSSDHPKGTSRSS